MPPKTIRITGADEWLLKAIRFAGGEGPGASLQGIISAGDMINHAIFTPVELRTGFAKLLAAKFIQERDGKWFVNMRNRNPAVVGDSKSWPDPNVQDPLWNYPLTDVEITSAIQGYLSRPNRPG